MTINLQRFIPQLLLSTLLCCIFLGFASPAQAGVNHQVGHVMRIWLSYPNWYQHCGSHGHRLAAISTDKLVYTSGPITGIRDLSSGRAFTRIRPGLWISTNYQAFHKLPCISGNVNPTTSYKYRRTSRWPEKYRLRNNRSTSTNTIHGAWTRGVTTWVK